MVILNYIYLLKHKEEEFLVQQQEEEKQKQLGEVLTQIKIKITKI